MARYDAVVFDLLSAVIDSWSLWNAIAGSEARGIEWRKALLKRVYSTGAYQPYDQLVSGSARDVGLPEARAAEVLRRWDELQPWPEAREVLSALARHLPLAVVTNRMLNSQANSLLLNSRSSSRTNDRGPHVPKSYSSSGSYDLSGWITSTAL